MATHLPASQGGVVLATTENGPYRSEDSGATWAPVTDAPVLIFTTFAGDTAIGVTPVGGVHTSADAALTWEQQESIEGKPEAIAATHTNNDDTHRIWVATTNGVQVSSDNGATFTQFAQES